MLGVLDFGTFIPVVPFVTLLPLNCILNFFHFTILNQCGGPGFKDPYPETNTIVIFYVFHGAGTEFKLCWVIILHLKIKLTEPSCSDLLA